jgi:hypothetical protein
MNSPYAEWRAICQTGVTGAPPALQTAILCGDRRCLTAAACRPQPDRRRMVMTLVRLTAYRSDLALAGGLSQPNIFCVFAPKEESVP